MPKGPRGPFRSALARQIRERSRSRGTGYMALGLATSPRRHGPMHRAAIPSEAQRERRSTGCWTPNPTWELCSMRILPRIPWPRPPPRCTPEPMHAALPQGPMHADAKEIRPASRATPMACPSRSHRPPQIRPGGHPADQVQWPRGWEEKALFKAPNPGDRRRGQRQKTQVPHSPACPKSPWACLAAFYHAEGGIQRGCCGRNRATAMGR